MRLKLLILVLVLICLSSVGCKNQKNMELEEPETTTYINEDCPIYVNEETSAIIETRDETVGLTKESEEDFAESIDFVESVEEETEPQIVEKEENVINKQPMVESEQSENLSGETPED